MKLFLEYKNLHRGPGKVVSNLLKGLDETNIEVVKQPNKSDVIGCLQDPGGTMPHLPAETLMGPNLFVLPFENPALCDKFKNFVVPSAWVKEAYESYDIMRDKNIEIWPVGLDTEEWEPKTLKKESYKSVSADQHLDCFVYFKNRSQQDLSLIYKMCRYYKLNFEIIEYGTYDEDYLKNLCARSKFAILLTGTESQGVAYMNILNSDVPCYVFNKSTWSYNDDIKFPATSVPYFNEQCGVIADDLNLERFEKFIKEVDKKTYSPRSYILSNHTLAHSAQKYIELIKKAYKR